VFALDGKGTIPKVDRTVPPVVMPRTVVNATSRELAQGAAMYTLYCDRCHSADLNLVKSGAIPELRRATAETHAQFQEIARGGKRRVLDMPSFAEDMTADQARMIEAYVLVQARRGAGATIP
jgi:mono/diheme cytochrome c family protein